MPDHPVEVGPFQWFQSQSRAPMTICAGTAVGCVGTLVILCTDANPFGVNHISERFLQHVALGAVLVLAGAVIAAVGFASWCRGDPPRKP
jgi:hypothetical protein